MRLGDQKIDLVIKALTIDINLPIYEEARNTEVLLIKKVLLKAIKK